VDFGLQQADDYYDGLLVRFQHIADTQLMYPDISHIREGYRRSVYGAHSIYYRIESGYVFVVHIIGQQDLRL